MIPIIFALSLILLISLLFNLVVYLKLKNLPNNEIAASYDSSLQSNLTSAAFIDTFLSSFLKLLNQMVYSVEDASVNMRNILKQTNLLSKDSDININQLKTIQNQINNMYKKLEDSFGLSKKINSAFSFTHENIKSRKTAMIDSITQYQSVKDNILVAKDSIDKLVGSTREIQNMVTSIKEIASKTNMLALNASIEAARAGEHGKGFSVVAAEVKKLSHQTSEVADTVSKMLSSITKDSLNTQSDIDTTSKILDSQFTMLNQTVETINELIQMFSTINSYIDNLTNKNNDSYLACNDINITSISIVDSIQNNMNMIKEIDVSIQHESKTINTLNRSTENLKTAASDLFDLISKDDNTLIAVTEEYPPFIIENSNGDNQGIDIDILKEICKRNNINLKVFLAPFDLSLELAKKGKTHIVPTLSFTRERSSFLEFTNSYRDESRYILIKNKNSSVHFKNYNDMHGCTIGIITGYTYPATFLNDKNINKESSLKLETLFNKLLVNQIDAVLLNDYIGHFHITSNNLAGSTEISSYVLVSEEKFDARFGFSKAKKTSKYVEMFNNEFQKLHHDGTIKKIENKYLKK